jgi:hypothetical protein
MHQSRSRIVNEDEQRTTRRATFKPVMRRAVDLTKLAQASAARPGLVNARRFATTGLPFMSVAFTVRLGDEDALDCARRRPPIPISNLKGEPA